METDAPLDLAAPTLLKEKALSEDLKAKVEEDCCSQTSEETTDQNPPHNSNPDEDELLGPPADISVPGVSPMILSLLLFPWEMTIYECTIYTSKSATTTMTHGLKPWDRVCLNPHLQPCVMGPISILYVLYVLIMYCI